jgi:hypothetical protein
MTDTRPPNRKNLIGRFITCGVASGILSCYLTGCGAKQEEHRRVIKELEEAKASAVDAKKETEQLKQKLHVIEQERVAREAREVEERRQQEQAQQLGRRELTAQQWWPILRTKSMAEVKELLGYADESKDNDQKWFYYFKAVAPNSGAKESLVVLFRGGRVVGVGSTGMNGIIHD